MFILIKEDSEFLYRFDVIQFQYDEINILYTEFKVQNE